jgi:hypothetical protein
MAQTLSSIKAVSGLNGCPGKINTKKSKIAGTSVHTAKWTQGSSLFHIEGENKSQICGVF